ncbi:glycosyltransferase family 4 protein [Pelagibacteraceae bacterium]|nr:glycosyltransferase family 4 protein [Pelagibacteraceae bacterium]
MAVQLNGKLNLYKVIIITTQCFYPNIGGIEALMTGMATAMHKSGNDVLVVADGKKDESDIIKTYNIKRFNGWKPIRRIKKAKYINQLCNTRNIEAIYADSWKSIEYLKSIDVPIFVLAHGTEIQKNISNINFYKKFKQKRIFSSFKKSTKIIANSNYTKELIKESLKINANKINIIHPGIDIYEKFIQHHTILKIKNIINSSHPVILTLARLELRKGHKLILDALSRLMDKYPNLLYIIAGDGPSKKEIKQYARELQISDNIRFLGWITEPEKSVLLKSTNLFIMTPHIDRESVEGFGMSFIDAAFHGLATIGTDSGGIPDAIIDGKTGLVARTSDVSDITAKIDELLSNPKKRIALGKAGQKNALEKFQWDNKVREYLGLI